MHRTCASMLQPLLLSIAISHCVPALAVVKCESHGKVTYTDKKCEEGKTVEVPDRLSVVDTKADTERAQAAVERLSNTRMKQNADDEKRKKQEKSEARRAQKEAALATTHQRNCETLLLHQKWAQEDTATATRKTEDKAKRRARHAKEQYELQCGSQ